jgi:hypothetical protein
VSVIAIFRQLPSTDEVFVECASLSPLQRNELQAFLERQPEVRRVSRRLRVTDALVDPDTLGVVVPCFDLVVYVRQLDNATLPTDIGAVIVRKIAEWVQANKPREQSNGE